MSQRLLPCPFCGNEHPEIASGDSVICNGIDGETCWASNMFEMWNRRAPQAWTCDPPTVPGDYLFSYQLSPDDDWQVPRMMKLGEDSLERVKAWTDTRWFGPIPPLDGDGEVVRELDGCLFAGPIPEPSPAPPSCEARGPAAQSAPPAG